MSPLLEATARRAAVRRAVALTASLTVAMSAGALRAQSPGPAGAAGEAAAPAAPEVDVARQTRALELNSAGVQMMRAGDPERALSFFVASRELHPSAKNTTNMAICLHTLGRFDEALIAFEEVYLRFALGLDEEDRATISPAMADLRTKVGSLLVTATAGGEVFVDGRPRGLLPFKEALRLNAGRHTLRVVKDGFSAHESVFTIEPGKTEVVDIRLDPLVGRGQINVQTSGKPADVFVDGVRVGTTPWEGTLATGPHVVWTRRGDADGSAPTSVTIVEAQTALLRPVVASLGPRVRVRVDPPTARLTVEGEYLPQGTWDGRLPAGTYTFVAAEPGYLPVSQAVLVPEVGAPIDVVLQLSFDEAHPRWPRGAAGDLWLGALAGYAGSPTLASDAEEDCPSRCAGEEPWVHGFVVGARGGYRLASGLSFEIDAAFLWAQTGFSRTRSDTFLDASDDRVTFRLEHAPRLRGPVVTAGASYTRQVADVVSLEGRFTTGLLVAFADDVIDGTASTPGSETGILLADRNETLSAAAWALWPAATARFHLASFELTAGLGAIFVPTAGPRFAHDGFGAQPDRDEANPGAVGNAPLSDVIANERAFGPFVLLIPEIGLSTTL